MIYFSHQSWVMKVLLWLAKDRLTGVIILARLAKEVARRMRTLWAFMVVRATEVVARKPVLTVTP